MVRPARGNVLNESDAPSREPRTASNLAEGMGRRPRYQEWSPAPSLGRFVVCTWAGRYGDDGQPFADRVLPDGCMDLVWDGSGIVVAGPDTTSVLMPRTPGARFAGIRFRPGFAPRILGVPASELLDARIGAGELLGSRAQPVEERVARSPSLRAAARELEAAVAGWLPASQGADDLLEAALSLLCRAPSTTSVATLANELGVTERRLHRHFTAGVGYGPKMLQRVLRLQRFVALGARRRDGLAQLALEAGYADQAHLARDCRQLAGATPTHFLGYLVTASLANP
jgi:AraC-like DNA-binding protein